MLTTNRFQHVAATYDKTSGDAALYLDGTPVAQANLGFFTPRTIGDLYFGLRADSGATGSWFSGAIDELSVYGRALSGAEVQAIHSAGSSGKCPLAPVIAVQPQSQTVVAGATVTLSVGATGTRPLGYQWLLNSNSIPMATGSSLVLTNVQFSEAGAYSVMVSNPVGTLTSSNAVLTVTRPPALVQAANSSGVGAGAVTVPILLVANGNENGLAFTLDFDPTKLIYTGVGLDSGATNAALVSNASQATNGLIGIAVAMPTDGLFAPGTQAVAQVSFTAAMVTNAASTPVSFGSQVVKSLVVDANANPLAANFVSGLVSIAPTPLEGDVFPRPNGDEAVTLSDWVLVGRYAAGLDSPTNALEFQKADCAPRASLGDGAITVIDWVQAGRYMAGLDPLTPAGGPTGPFGPGALRVQKDPPPGPAPQTLSRQVQVLDTVILQGQSGTVFVNLKALGNENALGFTLSFDPSVLTYTRTGTGSDLSAAGGSMIVNETQKASGRVSLMMGLQPGASFAAGDQQVAQVSFSARASVSGKYPVTLLSQPVACQVSDPAAVPLAAGYVNGAITISGPPSLSIAHSAQAIVLSWPLWAANFELQEASGPLSPAMTWSSAAVTLTAAAGTYTASLAPGSTNKFYRLRQK